MKLKLVILFAVSSLGILSCYKTPQYAITPSLTFNRYETKSTIYTLGDTGSLFLDFTDGDGDLGLIKGVDSSSVISYINTKSATDSFFQQSYYVIPAIPQKGTASSISGTIEMKFKDALFSAYEFYFISRGKTIDTFSFKMKINDRAGHVSNEITTPPIIVKMP